MEVSQSKLNQVVITSRQDLDHIVGDIYLFPKTRPTLPNANMNMISKDIKVDGKKYNTRFYGWRSENTNSNIWVHHNQLESYFGEPLKSLVLPVEDIDEQYIPFFNQMYTGSYLMAAVMVNLKMMDFDQLLDLIGALDKSEGYDPEKRQPVDICSRQAVFGKTDGMNYEIARYTPYYPTGNDTQVCKVEIMKFDYKPGLCERIGTTLKSLRS
jgi:hypothetical protein